MNPDLTRAVELAANGEGDEALAIVMQLADNDDPDALYTLGDMYWRGALLDLDWDKAVDCFRAADASGQLAAGQVVTNLIAGGIGFERDWQCALERLAGEAERDTYRANVLALIEAMELDEAGNPAAALVPNQLATSPDILEFPGLFSSAECEHLVTIATPRLEPSLVTGPNLEQVPDPIRTSECAAIHDLIEDPAVHALNRRLAAASQSAFACGEPLLILRYRHGQHYLNHIDALPGLANQRIRTALVYLNEGYEGGHTVFPASGTSYRGQPGDAIVFRNVLDDGRPDQSSVHAGYPVVTGEKFLASRWIRERPVFNADGPIYD